MKKLSSITTPFMMLILMFIIPFVSSCEKDEDIDAKNDKAIKEYIAANNLVAEKTASGLYYVIDVPGTAQKPTINSDVRVTYTGFYTDEEVFDSNTLTFPLSGVIKGWQEGLQFFGKGGKGMLLVPSKMGYGSKPPAGIRVNAVLIFNIHLIDIK